MQVLSFPGCCTAKVIAGFGQEQAAGFDARATTTYRTDREMALDVDRLMRGPQIGLRMGSVVVQLTSRQSRGIRVLERLGFAKTEAQAKQAHGDTTLFTFTDSPARYIREVNINELFPVAAEPRPPKLLVKNLRPEHLSYYKMNLRFARHCQTDAAKDVYRRRAQEILNNPNNHV